MKSGDDIFMFNLTPTNQGNALTSTTKMKVRKQKGDTGVTNLGLMVSFCTAVKEGIT